MIYGGALSRNSLFFFFASLSCNAIIAGIPIEDVAAMPVFIISSFAIHIGYAALNRASTDTYSVT